MLEPRTLAGRLIYPAAVLVLAAINKDAGIVSCDASAEDRCRDTSLNRNRAVHLNRIVKDNLVRIGGRIIRKCQGFCS